MIKKNLPFIIFGLLLYLTSTTLSYAVFNFLNKSTTISTLPSPIATGSGFRQQDTSAPKTESCPLNGQMFTKAQRDAWEKRRPLGIMLENHEEARPQSGLSNADIIYEAVAEGGITRFLAIFYCNVYDTIVGPVRSARTYYLDFISEYGNNPLYAHVGGANQPGPANALGQIIDYGWLLKNDLSQFSISFPTFLKDPDRLHDKQGRPVATEHQMYSTTEKLWKVAADRGFTNVDPEGNKWDEKFESWIFKDDIANSSRPASASASIDFWEGYKDYSVKWVYDTTSNEYKRENGGVPHLDKNNNQQLTAKNIVITFMTERNANDGYENNAHLLYGTKGKGKMILLQDGKKIEGTWQKKDRLSRMKFFDAMGKETQFNKGKIWIEIVPTGTEIKFS